LVLRVERFQVAPVYDTSRIIYRQKPFTRDVYNYHRWRSNPGNLVSYFLVRDLRQSEAFKSVITREGSLKSSHVIEGTVDEFYEHDGNDSWKAVLSVSITLMAKNEPDVSKKILLNKKYSTRETCRQKNPQALAEAMSKAMSKLSASIFTDVYNALANAK
jgi:cholesterol transport system auxiliary component